MQYGGGLRLSECLALRVQDIDFDKRAISIRDGKGGKDRVTMLSGAVVPTPGERLSHVRILHRQDLNAGRENVHLPNANAPKNQNAAMDWRWRWVFPQRHRWKYGETGEQERHQIDASLVQTAFKTAVMNEGRTKRAGCHTARQSLATNLIEHGYAIRTVQELLGHKDGRTTMIYTHVRSRGPGGVRSPLDRMEFG